MKIYLKASAGLATAVCMMWGCSSEISSAVQLSPATYQSALSLNPLLYTTLDNVAAVMTPAFGTGQGASISTVPANDFKPALIGKGLLANKAGERVRYPQTNGGVQNIELEHGTMDFWYKPNYNHDNNIKYTIAGTGNFGASRQGSIHFGKHNNSNQNQLFLIFHDANVRRYEHNVAKASYYWRAGNWLQVRITWDFNVPAGEQNLHLYLNGVELPLTGQVSRGPQTLPAERSTELIYIGARDVAGGVMANGLHDEFRIWDHVIPPTPPAVASVSLSAPDSSLTEGHPGVQGTVVARDVANNILSLSGRTVVWTSSATGVATVSASGLVTPVSAGSTTIGVTVDGIGPATFALTVTAAAPAPVASVSVTAPDSSIDVGTAVQATVVARDAASNILPLTGSTVVWTSSAAGVATVAASGLVNAVGAGSATIGVTVDGVGPASFTLTVAPAAVASVSVTAPDSSLIEGDLAVQATVVARDAANNILSLTGRTIVWTSSATGVATVAALGLVTPVSAGSTTIEVTVDGVGPASFSLAVAPASVASVSVTAPDSSLIESDPAVQATVVARDAANNILSLAGRTIVWTSSATGVATVSASGVVTLVSAGSTTIEVTVDGVGPATFTLTVALAPASSVSVGSEGLVAMRKFVAGLALRLSFSQPVRLAAAPSSANQYAPPHARRP